MPLYRGRLYSVEEIQKLMFLKRYKEEMRLYEIQVFDHSNFSRDFIEDNLINTANMILLLAIDRFDNDFIEASDFNLIYDKVLTYIENIDLLGKMKVHSKIMSIAKELHYEPFVATT